MELLYVYDIHLEDGRKGLNWIEDDTKEELWSYFELSENSWKEILLEIEHEFGSKVIKYKYKFEDYDEDDDFQDDEE